MKREDVLSAMFEAEFSEPSEKAAKEKRYQDLLNGACVQTGRPLYVLQPAFLKVYPQYRAKRLGKELPDLPFDTRDK